MNQKLWFAAGFIALVITVLVGMAVFNIPPDKGKVKGTMSSSSINVGDPGTIVQNLGPPFNGADFWNVMVHFDNDPDPNSSIQRRYEYGPSVGARVKQSSSPEYVEPLY